MMKIAILITAHKNQRQIEWLINSLSKDFDIYIHLDQRSPVEINNSERVHVYKEFKSYWASFNFVKSQLLVLTEAAKKDYDRYIVITGQDVPLKSNKYIIDFFTRNANVEFFEYFKLPTEHWINGGIDRLNRYWSVDPERLQGVEKVKFTVTSKFLNILYKSPLAFLFKRKTNYQFYGGACHMDLTNHCVQKLVSYLISNPSFIRRFKYTFVPEETFWQTAIMNCNIETVIENKVLRYIDWESTPGTPKILGMEDYDKLMKSEFLFGRKFDENHDKKVIEEIYRAIN